MSKLCIIGFDDNKVIKDFIRLHVENLSGEKVFLNNYYPYYKEGGRLIGRFYSLAPIRQKLSKLLPYFLFHRLVERTRFSPAGVKDALGGYTEKHQVDVILAEFGNTGANVAPIAKELNIPLVVHFHGHDAHRKPMLTDELLAKYRFMFEYASSVLGVSKHMINTLQELGCPENKLIYNPYGPRKSFYDIQPQYGPTLLSVGRFTDIKANHLVVMAFKEALKSVPNAHLLMIGDGELLETCKTLAQVWGIDDRVTFTGAIPHQEIAEHFVHSCCFVQHSVTPSYGDAEGTPNTILEAAAAALPVISTRHAGIKDVVVENETGFLVDELDVQGMAQHMVHLLQNPERCREMGQTARKHIQNNYSSEMHIERLQIAIDAARQSH
ncbi:glycosyltransferase family 4 protein [Cerasicoccus maritimus]|uniref:glycosyltransferase family 4 protein n=1 Tax=Cerasicoccus maritimus TaxID=490089 RepID=UPI002852A309|nr:glycosyltransferase family 4 protein [Cerasicoccus maritimus]